MGTSPAVLKPQVLCPIQAVYPFTPQDGPTKQCNLKVYSALYQPQSSTERFLQVWPQNGLEMDTTYCYLHETAHESEAVRGTVPLVLPVQLLEICGDFSLFLIKAISFSKNLMDIYIRKLSCID